jgi:hypothetical protein
MQPDYTRNLPNRYVLDIWAVWQIKSLLGEDREEAVPKARKWYQMWRKSHV